MKRNYKPICLLLSLLLLFGIFVYLLTIEPKYKKAIREVISCTNTEEVKEVWNTYKVELSKKEEPFEKFTNATRTKLASFNLSRKETNKWIKELPPAPSSLNLIVVPDLSRRINIPEQIENDKLALKVIWDSFKEYVKTRKDTKDRLIIDVTDREAASGSFGTIADSLLFDLSSHKHKIHKLFFTEAIDDTYFSNIDRLYQFAQDRPLGADYVLYLKRYLASKLKAPTLFDNHINKVIIITDGYLEAEGHDGNHIIYTRFYGFQQDLYNAVGNNNAILDVINRNGLNIPHANIDLSNVEFLLCEVNERDSGIGYDFDVLKVYWLDWLKRMNAKSVVIVQKESASRLTREAIVDFIK